ncbi:histidine phosphatase family protein [Falsiphaeobacter marinintestinus]|uniref:histidine phosphatase family protein n=1 Tax=Falsiphaeobacter marinintestinus TaxID=1492905 RepID=UPI0011B4F39C|nr:histidine phosphatase family protein [Phaeobacter marinintestinus]
MTRLHLVRHGPTHAKAMVGWTDLPADLSDHAAIARLDDHLPADAVLISSDLTRSVHTADAIQGARRRLPHDAQLREINFGAWEMRNFREIEAEDPDRIHAYWTNPGDVRPPDGESWHQVRARVDAAIDTLIAAHPDQDLVIVVHFGVIVTQIQRALDLESTEAFGHKIDNLSVTRITRLPDGWDVGLINHNP